MLRILSNGKTGMQAMQDKMDTIANNLSNINTDGYKKMDASFGDLVYETFNRKGYPVSQNANRKIDPYNGTGVRVNGTNINNLQGNLQNTGVHTDFAIDGQGYFRINLDNGQKGYTRNGDFSINSLGKLTDKNGNPLDINMNEEFKDVTFTQDNFKVGKDGKILMNIDGKNYTEVGSIDLYDAIGDDSFVPLSGNIYVLKNGASEYKVNYENNNYNIEQDFLELSNVDIATEFTDMINAQRAFELNSKSLKTADDMWGMVNNLRSR